MLGLPLLLAAALATAPPNPAKADILLARKGLTAAVAAGHVAPADAAADRTILAAAPPLLRKLPPLRVAELRGVLHDVAALARSLLDAPGERGLPRPPPSACRRHRRRQRRGRPLPGVLRPRARLPPARQLRAAEQPRERTPGRGGGAGGRSARRARHSGPGREPSVRVRVPVLGRRAAVDLRHGAGRRGAGARARRRRARRLVARRRGQRRLPGRPRPPPPPRRRPVDPALRLEHDRRPERPAADLDLARLVRQDERQRGGGHPRRQDARRRPEAPAALRHRLLVAL